MGWRIKQRQFRSRSFQAGVRHWPESALKRTIIGGVYIHRTGKTSVLFAFLKGCLKTQINKVNLRSSLGVEPIAWLRFDVIELHPSGSIEDLAWGKEDPFLICRAMNCPVDGLIQRGT